MSDFKEASEQLAPASDVIAEDASGVAISHETRSSFAERELSLRSGEIRLHCVADCVQWLQHELRRLGGVYAQLHSGPLAGVLAIVERQQVRVAVVTPPFALGFEADWVLMIGDPHELAEHLPEAYRGQTHVCPLPCSADLLESCFALAFSAAENRRRAQIVDRLLAVGVSLNSETDPTRLLERILREARLITGADAGSVYTVETVDYPAANDCPPAERRLRFHCAQNDSVEVDFQEFSIPVDSSSIAGSCALQRACIRIDDLYAKQATTDWTEEYPQQHNRSFDRASHYQTRSLLTVPMSAPSGELLGVIQLINAKDGSAPLVTSRDFERRIRAFDHESERVCLSLAAQGAVALENARLYANIEGLFRGFVTASVMAIEQRDPTTSGHSERVADLTVTLAKQVDAISDGTFEEVNFDEKSLRELEYAALLHDFGKVGVRENILVKSKKLFDHRLELLRERYEHMITALHWNIASWKLRRENKTTKNAEEIRKAQEMLHQLDAVWPLILQANEPSILPDERRFRLSEIMQLEVETPTGRKLRLLDEEDLKALSIAQGTLTDDERSEIRSHVVHTYRFLRKIPWGQSFGRVPEIASKHHEYLDGSGYPYGLTKEQIPIQAQIMTICDIFDALTAPDRPYKKSMSVDSALDVLGREASRGRVNRDLLEIFIGSKSYRCVDPSTSMSARIRFEH